VLPSRAKAWAISHPIGPPPRIASDDGSRSRVNRVSLVSGRESRRPGSRAVSNTSRSGKAITGPKGRPTAPRDEVDRRRSDRMIALQWAGVGLAVVALLVLAVIVSGGQEPIPLHQR
jgi:hypothetical protein